MRRWMAAGAALAVPLMAALVAGSILRGERPLPGPPRAGAASGSSRSGPARGAVLPASARSAAAPVRLATGATVQVIIQYVGCDAQRSGEGPLPVGLVGLDRGQVAGRLVDTSVVSVSADRLVLRREMPGCPGDAVTLVARDGMVVVVAGRPGDLGRVVARTDLAVRALGPEARRRLERGIVAPADAWERVVAELRRG